MDCVQLEILTNLVQLLFVTYLLYLPLFPFLCDETLRKIWNKENMFAYP